MSESLVIFNSLLQSLKNDSTARNYQNFQSFLNSIDSSLYALFQAEHMSATDESYSLDKASVSSISMSTSKEDTSSPVPNGVNNNISATPNGSTSPISNQDCSAIDKYHVEQEVKQSILGISSLPLPKLYYWTVLLHNKFVENPKSLFWSSTLLLLVRTSFDNFFQMDSDRMLVFLLALHQSMNILIKNNSSCNEITLSEYYSFIVSRSIDALKWASAKSEELEVTRVVVIQLLRTFSASLCGIYALKKKDEDYATTVVQDEIPTATMENLVSFCLSNLKSGAVSSWTQSNSLHSSLTIYILTCIQLTEDCLRLVSNFDLDTIDTLSNFLNEIPLKDVDHDVRPYLQSLKLKAIGAIAQIGIMRNEHAKSVLKILYDFMGSNMYLSANHPIITKLSDAIGELLAADCEQNDIILTSHFVNGVAQDIFVDSAVERYRHNCVLLATIAQCVNDREVTQPIALILIQVLTRAKKYNIFDTTINRQLIKVALLKHGDTFYHIVDEIFTFYKDPQESSIDKLPSLFGDALYNLTTQVVDRDLISHLLNKSLDLFTVLGKKFCSKSQTQDSKDDPIGKEAEYLGVLIAPISQLAKASNLNTIEPDSDIQNKFKSLWFIVIIFGLCIKWKTELGLLSQYSPILSEVDSKTYFEGLKSHIETFSHSNLEILQQQLSQILKGTTAFPFASHLDHARTVYFLSIYHLESFRVQNVGSLRHLLTYHQDNSLNQGYETQICLKCITSIVFQKWISCQKLQFNQDAIEEQVVALFSQLGNRRESVRNAAAEYLEHIRGQFSFVMWSPLTISAYLEMLRVFDNSLKFGPTTNLLQCQLPDKVMKTMYLPQELEKRNHVFTTLHNTASKWMVQALEFAPNAFKAALEEYLLKCQHSFDGNQYNYGETLAILLSSPINQLNELEVAYSYRPKDQRHGLYLASEIRDYSVSQSTAIKSYHYGQAKSLKSFVGDFTELESYILKNLTTAANKFKLTMSNDNLTHFNDALQLATAFSIISRHISLPILQKIVWSPIECFTPESLESGAYCWHWICTSRSGDKIEVALLNEMSQAWNWFIDERRCFFSGTEAEHIPLDLTIEIEPSNLIKEFHTQRLWINFIAERFQIAQKVENSKVQTILSKMVVRSLEDSSRITSHRNSFGCRIRLCFLALIMAIRTNDAILACSLRQKAYDTLLSWFTYHPSWYQTHSSKEFSEDMRLLQEFIEKLKKEQKFAQESNAFSGLFDPSTATIPKAHQLTSKDIPVPQINSIMETLTNIPSNSIHSYMFPRKSYEKLDLLILFLGHEMQRQNIFHNPRNDNNLGVRYPSRQVRPTQWEKLLNEAWSINPRLAFQFGTRFQNDTTTKILTSKVLSDTESVVDISEAVNYLITKEHITENKPQLSYLSIWTPSTITAAVRFLNVPYVHNEHVRRYALRSLRFYSPKYIIFYTSQLLQCLRHDTSNELKNFFLELVNKSAFFAHRLIWTCRTEIVNKEELDKEELKALKPAELAMSKICDPFEKVILNSLDARGKHLYDEEFTFFQKMTDISGELVQFEKGSVMRKEKLVEFLQRVKDSGPLSKHLYLPSNTDSRVVDFDPKGARVLKSSKKVPIMVPFHVKTSSAKDIGDEDVFDDSRSQKQLCIFKMGDDCRQDVLALQLISMFKSIFERAGLPLYLFPYRVITTGRGTGIIEVVPNTKSRHDIGALTEGSLYEYFINEYGHPTSPKFQTARKRFIESMAAYSVVSYILNIKDRHNGNILIDQEGHIIHIDFGFLFDTAPGGKFSIEKSAFKLNTEMLKIMGENPGVQKQHSEGFLLFKDLVLRGFLAAREYIDDLVALVEVMLQSELPCFVKGGQCIKNLKYRLAAGKTEEETVAFMNERIQKAYQSIFSFAYDKYQEIVEKINM